MSNVVVRVLRAKAPVVTGAPYAYAFPRPGAWYHSIVVWVLNRIQ